MNFPLPSRAKNPAANIDTAALYQPQPKQLAFHSDSAPYRLQIGGSGSGKSMAMLWEAVNSYCLRYANCQALLLRKDFPELEKGLISDLRACLPANAYHWNDQKKIATFPNGSQLFFGHCSSGSERDLSQYLSSAFVCIGIDELGQFSYEAWDFLRSRNRVNAACKPCATTHQMPVPRMVACTNPTGPGYGWIRALWIDHRIPACAAGAQIDFSEYTFVHSTIYDNPAQIKKDPRYISKLESLAPALRRKYLDGDLNSIAGQYYSNFDETRHVIRLADDPDRIIWQPWQPAWIGLDWGLAHHTAVFWFTRGFLRQFKGTRIPVTVIYRELAIRETSIEDVARLISEMTSGGLAWKTPSDEHKALKRVFASHELFARRTDPNPDKTVAAEMSRALRRHNLPALERAPSNRVSGAVIVYEHLDRGDLVILSNCELLIRAIPSLVRDERELEDVKKFDTLEDDLFDALKYGAVPMLGVARTPPDVPIREHAASIKDALSRWFYLQKNLPANRPIVVKPNVAMRWEKEA